LQRKDLYSLGRSAVLMGLLSYSFVTVTLIADLGLPLHSYQLALQHPEHSAMFEVSWCVGLYVTVLLFEFLPVAFERWNMDGAMRLWRRWSGAYVAFAATLFRLHALAQRGLAAATAAIFGACSRGLPREERRFEPIVLGIAAVTLSTMHQSSLGSLFLLMPDKLAAQWWSPVMPVSFFLSSIAAGTALVVLIEMWISKAGGARSMGSNSPRWARSRFWSLLVYLAFRLGDMTVRRQMGRRVRGTSGRAVRGRDRPRRDRSAVPARQQVDALATERADARHAAHDGRRRVQPREHRYFAMNVKGPMPWTSPDPYTPSMFEWGLSIGLIAATIFLFGLGARYLPLLPKRVANEGH
jgi:formate dehydrogenase iron-sulfur subunit